MTIGDCAKLQQVKLLPLEFKRKESTLNRADDPASEFAINHLRWTVRRSRRTFTVRVVEPTIYDPGRHGLIFTEVLVQQVNPRPMLLDGLANASLPMQSSFDLITFPEAFAPGPSLVEAMTALAGVEDLGCIHVGLRSSDESHLFAIHEAQRLVERILNVRAVESSDLQLFTEWLQLQSHDSMLNLGCLFTTDHAGRLRVCLHPKAVRSQFENNALHERHMHEANFLSLVTLVPSNKRFLSVTLQPLLCSDVLNLQTDRGTGSPIVEVNRQANKFENPPDHIDVVSVATCTPQVPALSMKGTRHREWHQDFRTVFCSAAQDGNLTRHHFATFVLSNFHSLPSNEEGGLSGVFQPIDPNVSSFHPAVKLSCYGYPKSQLGNNRWSTPNDDFSDWRIRGFVAFIDPTIESDPPVAKIFGFRLPYLLRDRSLWATQLSLSVCEVTAAREHSSGDLMFDRVGNSL